MLLWLRNQVRSPTNRPCTEEDESGSMSRGQWQRISLVPGSGGDGNKGSTTDGAGPANPAHVGPARSPASSQPLTAPPDRRVLTAACASCGTRRGSCRHRGPTVGRYGHNYQRRSLHLSGLRVSLTLTTVTAGKSNAPGVPNTRYSLQSQPMTPPTWPL